MHFLAGYTMDKVPVYDKAFEDDALPETGEDILIIISHVESIQHFYGQMRKENKSVVNSSKFKIFRFVFFQCFVNNY